MALSGNPLGWHRAARGPIGAVPWHQLQVGTLLGEGASGLIYRAHHHISGESLALKVFKGEVTSDGLPEHELAACLAAGQHPALCTPSGELVGHPQGARGLLLPLIPPTHINLAGPPSLASCTRDVYPPNLRIAASSVLNVARQMAAAIAHLHQQGVMHGDLYAHNILWNPANGEALLSDFGAATLLPQGQSGQRRALQALEVRAFGCLLDELALHAEYDGDHARVMDDFNVLAQACLTLPADRPDMGEVVRQLRR